MNGSRWARIGALVVASCGGPTVGTKPPVVLPPKVPGVSVEQASGRPRLALVRRDGDPSPALAIEVRGEGLGLAWVGAALGARLQGAGLTGVEVLSGARVVRVRALVPALSAVLAERVDLALTSAIGAADLPALQRATEAYGDRPVDDPALATAGSCLDRPTRPASFTAPPKDSLVAAAEAARASVVRHDRVTVGIVGMEGMDAFVAAFRARPTLPGGGPLPALGTAPPLVSFSAHESIVVAAMGVPRASAGSLAASLADPTAALALRLRALDVALTSVRGVAWPEGGCLVVEVTPPPAKEWNEARALAHAANAVEVTRQEIALSSEALAISDGHAAATAIAGAGDPREAADRAAFWAYPATTPSAVAYAPSYVAPPSAIGKLTPEAVLPPLVPKLVAAIDRARIAGARAELELRSRTEVGQGQVFALLASTCGATHEGANDAGLGALAMRALVAAAMPEPAKVDASAGVVLEPWPTSSGLGVLARAMPHEGEGPDSLAHRVGDALGRAMLAAPLSREPFLRIRGEALSELTGPKGTELVQAALFALAPAHESWLDARGTLEAVAKASPELAELRLGTLRKGPLRLAVVGADGSAAKVARAAERWVPRAPGESRACPLEDPGPIPKGMLHARTVKAGTGFALAVPVEDNLRDAGPLLSALLEARLAPELGAHATRVEARFVRGMGRHALVVVVLAADANVDPAVVATRAVLDKVRAGAFTDEEVASAEKSLQARAVSRALDPRARLVDVWTGPSKPSDAAGVRKAAAIVLVEERHQLVLAHLK